MKRPFLLLSLIASSILVLDQWTKHWAAATLAGRPPVDVLGEFVRFTYTRNSGVAFGLGAGIPFPYAVFSLAAVVAILYLFARQRVTTPVRQVAFSLILGGALGNLVDRLVSGEVVDFILVGWRRWYWPVFNVADSAVSVGVVLFGLTLGRRPQTHDAEPATSSDDPLPPTFGAGHEQRGAAGSLPRTRAD